MKRSVFGAAVMMLLAASPLARAAGAGSGIVLTLQSPPDPDPTAAGAPAPGPAPSGRWVGTPGFQAGETVTSIAIESAVGVGGLIGLLYTGTLACPSLPPSSADLPKCAAAQVSVNFTLMAIPSLISSLVVQELARQDGVHAPIWKLQAWSLAVRAPLVTASSVFLGLALSPKNQPGLNGDLFVAILFDLASFVIGPVMEVAAANWLQSDPDVPPQSGAVNAPAAAVERPAADMAQASVARPGEIQVPVMAFSL